MSSDLFCELRQLVDPGHPARDDIVADLALLVVEGRIDGATLRTGVAHYLPSLRRKYRSDRNSVSFDAPVRRANGDEGSALSDLLVRPGVGGSSTCPNCRKRTPRGRTYCSPTCAVVYAAHRRRRVHPDELRHLHRERWLSVDATARALGVSRTAVISAIGRYRLSRRLPARCRIGGCGAPAWQRRHIYGWIAGTLCKAHAREAARRYNKASRERMKRDPERWARRQALVRVYGKRRRKRLLSETERAKRREYAKAYRARVKADPARQARWSRYAKAYRAKLKSDPARMAHVRETKRVIAARGRQRRRVATGLPPVDAAVAERMRSVSASRWGRVSEFNPLSSVEAR